MTNQRGVLFEDLPPPEAAGAKWRDTNYEYVDYTHEVQSGEWSYSIRMTFDQSEGAWHPPHYIRTKPEMYDDFEEVKPENVPDEVREDANRVLGNLISLTHAKFMRRAIDELNARSANS